MQSRTSCTSRSNFESIMDGKKSVRILILSANLGNAQPDDPSLSAWIPHNGYCKFAIQDPPLYPVVMDPSSLASDDILFHQSSEGVIPAASPINKIETSDHTEQATDVAAAAASSVTDKTDEFIADFSEIAASDDNQTSEDKIETSTTEKEDPFLADFPPVAANWADSVEDPIIAEDQSGAIVVSVEEPVEFLFNTAFSDSVAEEDDYAAFLAGQAAHEAITTENDEYDEAIDTADDEYNAFLAAQAAHVTQDEEEDANGGDAEYTKFLAVQNRNTMEYEKSLIDDGFSDGIVNFPATHGSGHHKNDSDEGSCSLPPPFGTDFAEAFPTWESSPAFPTWAPSPSILLPKVRAPLAIKKPALRKEKAPPSPNDVKPLPEQEVDTPPADDELSLSLQTKPQNEQFDIIVIGMQEATFDTSEEGNDDFHPDDDNAADDGSLSSSSSDEEEAEESMGTSTTASAISTDDDIGLADTVNTKRSKSLTGKVLGATLKVGKLASKSTLKVGKVASKSTLKAGKKTMKVGKATVKAGKAAKTLTKEKDHTKARTPSAQQSHTPLEDGLSEWNDTKILHYLFEDQLPSYKRALSYQLGEMRLMIYYLKSEVNLDILSVKAQATGKAGLANKGGIVAEVAVNDTTRLAFLTAHLEAHEGEEKYAKRCSSFRDIFRASRSSVTPYRYDASLASHFMFSMGDLNFRTKLPSVESGSPQHIQACHELAAKKDWVTLNQHDELAKALREKECLVGFRTPYCNFDPTFKVSRTNGYEYNVKRSPSYTDRILFKTGDQLEPALKTILYEPVGTFTTSDHKPIRAVFDIRLNEKLRWTGKQSSFGKHYSVGSTQVSQPSTLKIAPENMHIFVSSIRCNIDQTEYNKGHKTNDSKADLPSPFVSFVSTPSEAIRTDASKRGKMWNKLRKHVERTKTSSSNSQSNGSSTKKTSSLSVTGWPGTTTLPSTFKGSWSNEVHFVVRTHHQDGDPIELSGALLHISVFDNKGSEPKLLGSFSFNLARLIEISTEPQENLTDDLLDDSTNEMSGWSYSQRAGPSKALYGAWKEGMPTPVRTVAKWLNQTQKPTAPGRGRLDTRGRGQHGKRGPPKQPLPPTVMGRGQPGTQGPHTNNLPSRVPDQSQLRKQGPPEPRKQGDPKLYSLKLDEPLTESGKVVGRVKCSIDAWWMEDNEPA